MQRGLFRWVLMSVALTIVAVAPAAAPDAAPSTAWDEFRAKWDEAFSDRPAPSSVTIERLSIVDGGLVRTPETLSTTDFLARVKDIATQIPVATAAPTSFLIAGHRTPQPPTIGALWFGFSVFACASITPMTGVTNVPNVSGVQSAGVLGVGLRAEEQLGIALADVQVLPAPAPFPVLDAPAVDADVAILRPTSFSLCLTFFGIPLFSTTFLDLDGDLSA